MDQYQLNPESKKAHHQAVLSCICSFGEGSEKAAILEAALITSPFPKHLQQREVSAMHDLVLSSVAGSRAPSSSLYVEGAVSHELHWRQGCWHAAGPGCSQHSSPFVKCWQPLC